MQNASGQTLERQWGPFVSILIWIGAATTLIGVAGLLYSGALAYRAGKSGQDDVAIRAAMQTMAMINMAAFAVAGIGLTMVVVGLILR